MQLKRFIFGLMAMLALCIGQQQPLLAAKKVHKKEKHNNFHLTDAEIVELTLSEAKKALDRGKLTSEHYITVLFERIEQLSPKITDDPTKLNAFLVYNKEQALWQARCSDMRRKEGRCVRPLEGLPILPKDFFDVAGLNSTSSTPGIRNCFPSTNSEVVQSLVDAGAIVIGKANQSEVGLMVHCANDNFAGVVRNPYDFSYTPGGSSGGSSAAAAARLCPVTLGTDLGGSIRWPASCCGIIGYRPSQDRWSNKGVSEGVDLAQCGPLARSVEDIILLDTIVTKDSSKVRVKPRKIRIGVPREYFYEGQGTFNFPTDPELEAAIDATIAKLQEAGVTIIDQNMGSLPLLDQLISAWAVLSNYQINIAPTGAQAFYNNWAADPLNPFQPTTVGEVNSQVVSPDAINAIAFLASLPSDPGTIAFFTDIRNQIIALVNQYMDDNDLDAILLPVSPILTPLNPNPTDATNYGTLLTAKSATVPTLKFPAINMPVGIDSNGLPMGVDLIARNNDDRRLLAIAKKLRPCFATIPAPSL